MDPQKCQVSDQIPDTFGLHPSSLYWAYSQYAEPRLTLYPCFSPKLASIQLVARDGISAMVSPLVRLIYVSMATRQFGFDELNAFLDQSLANKERLDITGVPLHKGGRSFRSSKAATMPLTPSFAGSRKIRTTLTSPSSSRKPSPNASSPIGRWVPPISLSTTFHALSFPTDKTARPASPTFRKVAAASCCSSAMAVGPRTKSQDSKIRNLTRGSTLALRLTQTVRSLTIRSLKDARYS